MVGEPAAAAAGVEVEAWSDTARWPEDQTCCSQSQMLTLQLLVQEGEKREKINPEVREAKTLNTHTDTEDYIRILKMMVR